MTLLITAKIIITILMIAHLNNDSVQNKLDDLKLLKRELKSQVIFLSETKIDSSYKDDQFSMRGYNMFRKDHKKGGGGLMAFISTNILHPRKCQHQHIDM